LKFAPFFNKGFLDAFIYKLAATLMGEEFLLSSRLSHRITDSFQIEMIRGNWYVYDESWFGKKL